MVTAPIREGTIRPLTAPTPVTLGTMRHIGRQVLGSTFIRMGRAFGMGQVLRQATATVRWDTPATPMAAITTTSTTIMAGDGAARISERGGVKGEGQGEA